MSLDEFETAIKRLPCKVYHYTGGHQDQYIVWSEYGRNSLRGDGTTAEWAGKIQVDIFAKPHVKPGYSPLLDALLELLEEIDAAYDDPIISYEQDPEYIHVIVDCEVY